MRRFIGVSMIGLFATAMAQADLRPPDTRYIPLEHKIETDKDFPNHAFYTVRGNGEVKAVKLDMKTPVVIAGNAAVGRGPALKPGEKQMRPYRGTALVAVPKGAEKAFPDEKALQLAIFEKKLDGAIESKVLHEYEAVKMNDPRKSATLHHKIEKLDAKEGIVLAVVKDAPKPEEEETAAAGFAGTSSRWLALGLALSAAFGFTGLWISRRRAIK